MNFCTVCLCTLQEFVKIGAGPVITDAKTFSDVARKMSVSILTAENKRAANDV